MSKVRPRRGSKTSTRVTQPYILSPEDVDSTEDNYATTSSFETSWSSTSSISATSSSEHTTYPSQVRNMFKNSPFRSDVGFGAMNPMYDDTDEAAMPPDLPSPIKPTIATSHSMPTMPSMYTTINGTLSPKVATTAVCSSVTSTSPQPFPTTPNVTPAITPHEAPQMATPPNTPLSSQSRAPSPRRTKSETYKSPTSNPISPDLATPPNTPFSQPSSPDPVETKDQRKTSSTSTDEVVSPTNPAMMTRGKLYNILGYPVDLPDIRPVRRDSIQISPDATETDLYPFPSYPNPYIIDPLSESEKVIRDLVNLGNGRYDEGNEQTGDKGMDTNVLDGPAKNDEWRNLEDQEQRVTACWNHNLDRPKVDDQKQRQEENHNSKVNKKKENNQSTSGENTKAETLPKSKDQKLQMNEEISKDKSIDADEKSKQKKPKTNIYENQRDSLYSHLRIPMIDEDVDHRKPDSPAASSGGGTVSTSTTEEVDCFGSEAAELAEQLCEVTSEAGRLLAKELKEGINYLTQPEDTLEFTWIDALTGVISIGAFYFDLVSDSLVAYYMFDDPDSKYWFRVTLLLIILPLVLANGYSLYWYWFDERVCEPQGACFKHPKVPKYVWVFRVLAHLLLQASPLRQLDIIYYGTKSTAETVLREALVDEVMEAALVTQPEDYPAGPDEKKRRGSRRLSFRQDSRKKSDPLEPLNTPVPACSRRTNGVCSGGGYVALWIHSERDAANVDLLLSLVQDAPLLILHIYIMAHTLPEQVEQGKISQTIIMQILSVAVSLLTLAWSVASFVRAIRLNEPTMCNLSLLDLLMLTLSHFCSIAGQVMSFALFASKLLVAFCIIGTIHWCAMSVWILVQLLCFPRTPCTRAMFAHDKTVGPCNRLDDVLYSSTMGLILLFTFVDAGGVAPRTQSLLYHIFRLAEEATLLTIWFVWVNGSAWYHWLPLILVPVLFCLNLFFDGIFNANTKPVQCIAITSAPQAV